MPFTNIPVIFFFLEQNRIFLRTAVLNKNYASDSYGARDHFNYRFDGNYLTSDEAKALADYAKAKKMIIREFLTANGFDMTGVAKDAVLITSEAKIDESVSSAVK